MLKIANQTPIDKPIIVAPSLIPDVEYPTTDREEQLINLAYQHGYKQAKRHWKDDDRYMLELFRERVQQIRKERGLK